MTDEPASYAKSVDARDLDREEQSLVYYSDLVAAGTSVGDALRAAVTHFPEEAEVLADYALYTAALAHEPALVPANLDAMIESAASRHAAQPDVLNAGILKRIGTLGISIEDVCVRMRIARSVLTKLDRRLIDPDSIPARFLRDLAAAVHAPDEVLGRYLMRSPGLSAASEYKSTRAPRAGRQQSFDAALRSAVTGGDLSQADRDFWTEHRPQ